jgi:hypothetical protein
MNKAFAISILALALLAGSVWAYAPWSANVRVSTGSGNETEVAIDHNYAYAVWNDGSGAVGFNRSTNGGTTWGTSTIIPTSYCDACVFVDDSGYVYVSYLSSGTTNTNIARSTDHGATWGMVKAVSINQGGRGIDKCWEYVHGSRVYVAWMAYSGNIWDIRLVKSTDRGVTFANWVKVNNNADTVTYRQFPIPWEDSRNPNLVYCSMTMDRRRYGTGYNPPRELYIAKSTDGGVTWPVNTWVPDTLRLPTTSLNGARISCEEQMCVSQTNGDVYVTYYDSSHVAAGKLDVFFSRSTDAGLTFSRPTLVPTIGLDTSNQFFNAMTSDPYGRIHVVWRDSRNGGGRLAEYYAYSTDRGTTWSVNEQASDTATTFSGFMGDYQGVTADSSFVATVWTDTRSGTAAWFSKRSLPSAVEERDIAQRQLPMGLTLLQSYPNPTRGEATIPFALNRASTVRLTVYNALGQEVTTLLSATLGAGTHSVSWNGRDIRGRPVDGGVYFYQLTRENETLTKRLTILR